MTSRNGQDGTLAILVRLAERQQGVSGAEAASATGKTSDACTRLMTAAVGRGRLHRAGPHMRKRWFVHPEHAAAYERAVAVEKAGVAVHIRAHRPDGPSPARIEGEPIITSHTKVTIAPAPRSRYAADIVRPVVSAAECREWALHIGQRNIHRES